MRDQAWPTLARIGLAEGADRTRLRFTADQADALAGAGLVQENGPERSSSRPSGPAASGTRNAA